MAKRRSDGEGMAVAIFTGVKFGGLAAFGLLMLFVFGGGILVALGVLPPLDQTPFVEIVLSGFGVGFIAFLVAYLRFRYQG